MATAAGFAANDDFVRLVLLLFSLRRDPPARCEQFQCSLFPCGVVAPTFLLALMVVVAFVISVVVVFEFVLTDFCKEQRSSIVVIIGLKV